MVDALVDRLPAGEFVPNVAWFDPEVLERAGASDGAVVELVSRRGRRLLAYARPRSQDRGAGVVRLDRLQLRLLKPGIREAVGVEAAAVDVARRVTLEPLAPLPGDLGPLERAVAKSLEGKGQLAQVGMLFQVQMPQIPRPVLFRVVTVEPGRAVIADDTRVILRPTMLLPGTSANLVTFDDIGGLQPEIRLIRELVECPLKYPKLYEAVGIDATRGVILCGPPGVGKTHLARAIANEVGAHFVYINGPEVVSSLHGGTEANIRRVFEEARQHAPAVVLIDEVDSVAPQRGETGSQADVRVGSQLLTLLDGLIAMEDVVVIGTTNRVNSVDPALRRPGRFDREVFMRPPNMEGRLEILDIHTRRVPLDEEALAFMPALAGMTYGYVGADLMDLVRRAGLHALRRRYGVGFAGARVSGGDAADAEAADIAVRRDDLEAALEETSPSALREAPLRNSQVEWSDVGGLEEAISVLRSGVEIPLRKPEACHRFGVRPLTGILLYGPPGTGKTLLVDALAHECGVNYIAVRGPEIFSKWFGESEERVRYLFGLARQVSPAILFFEQMDAIAPRRGADGAPTATERVVNQLLIELDAVKDSPHIIVIGATSRFDLIDPALLRPGRFEHAIPVERPHRDARLAILTREFDGVPRSAGEDWAAILRRAADVSQGLTGADLKAAVDRAKRSALEAADFDLHAEIGEDDFVEALEAIRARQAREAPSPAEAGATA